MRTGVIEPLRARQATWALPVALAMLVVAGWLWSLRAAALHLHALHGAGFATLVAMWAAMSVGMMVPVEAPSLLRAARAHPEAARPAAFLAGYLAPWIAFSICAALLQERLHQAGWMGADMALREAVPSAALLAAAGLLQLSPLRQACLSRCRAESVAASYRGFAGGTGAAVASIACCGLLMLVPFATGVMSAAWMAALTALLVVEREFPRAARAGTAAGILLLAFAAWRIAG
ncbi:MAG TPA: DUF2182 domain-containing protein [Myxococcales bacterium]|nr:DUF2182 domain-containing protein [Myxococcales bacterium]